MKITHAVTEDGTVYCTQQRKMIDVMTCYGCEKVIEIDLDTRHPKVTCAAAASAESRSR